MKVAIFGTSGFAREVAEICEDAGYQEVVLLSKENENSLLSSYTIMEEKNVYELKGNNFDFLIGVGDTEIRKTIAERYSDISFINIIHPSATVGKKTLKALKESEGNIFSSGSRVTSDVEIGNFGIYNLNITIGHDCIIEDFVTITNGANVSGNVHLKEGVYVGTNSTILQGKSLEEKLSIGKYSVVGAGSVVTKNVPERVIVKGVPAK